MRVVIVTKIFPNAVEPDFAPYNLRQFSELARHCEVRLIAPVPWFPLAGRVGARTRAALLSDIPAVERMGRLEVEHPRILHTPKLSGLIGPAYAASLLPRVLSERGRADLVFGAFAYPDGYAAVRLADALGVPATIKLHGGDVNVVAKLPGPRWHLRRVLPRAARVIAVSKPLAEEVAALGARPDRIDIVPNGVDRTLFRLRERAGSRRDLGRPVERRLIVYVGRIERRKGVFELLEAFDTIASHHADVDLALIGNGEDEGPCRERAAPFGDRVVFAGPLAPAGVAGWIGASDVVTLPSHNEGTPNVLIEALTSGRRVVATRVGGIPAVVSSSSLGELVAPEAPAELAEALGRAVAEDYDPAEVARLGGRGDWEESGRRLFHSLQSAVKPSS